MTFLKPPPTANSATMQAPRRPLITTSSPLITPLIAIAMPKGQLVHAGQLPDDGAEYRPDDGSRDCIVNGFQCGIRIIVVPCFQVAAGEADRA